MEKRDESEVTTGKKKTDDETLRNQKKTKKSLPPDFWQSNVDDVEFLAGYDGMKGQRENNKSQKEEQERARRRRKHLDATETASTKEFGFPDGYGTRKKKNSSIDSRVRQTRPSSPLLINY